jgi:uncharacterized protein (DUF433 family)
MVALEETISMPLIVTEHGTIRIKGSRVSLDSVIHHFKLGATAEQIVQSFPSLSLGDVYSSIAYYFTHRQGNSISVAPEVKITPLQVAIPVALEEHRPLFPAPADTPQSLGKPELRRSAWLKY